MLQQQPRKAVSKAQYRFFLDALRRIEAGGTSPIKGMDAEALRFALDGVNYDALTERAGWAVSKPKAQRPPQRLQPQP